MSESELYKELDILTKDKSKWEESIPKKKAFDERAWFNTFNGKE